MNETKYKELPISFPRSADSFEAVTINNKPIEVVTSVKLFGLIISNNLKWNAHIENVTKILRNACQLLFADSRNSTVILLKTALARRKLIQEYQKDFVLISTCFTLKFHYDVIKPTT